MAINLPDAGRNLLPAALAVVVAVGLWFGIGALIPEPAPPPAPVLLPPTQAAPVEPPAPELDPAVFPTILVATTSLAPGVMIESEMVDWIEWREPLDSPRSAGIDTVAIRDVVPMLAVLGSVTTKPFQTGAWVTWDGILTPGHPGFISAVLDEGMVAITIESDRATTDANIIYPGDHVDVIMFASESLDGLGGAAAHTVLRGVRVLAVGSLVVAFGRYGRVSVTSGGVVEPPPPPPGENYTLEVSPQDAERIVLARAVGELTLAMRSVNARNYPNPDRRGTPTRLREVMPVIPQHVESVRVIRGGRGTDEPSTST